jgi:hypothetical protein
VPEAFGGDVPLEFADRDFVVNLVTHSDVVEQKHPMLAAVALANVADGLILNGETGDVVSSEEMLQEARSIEPA